MCQLCDVFMSWSLNFVYNYTYFLCGFFIPKIIGTFFKNRIMGEESIIYQGLLVVEIYT